MSPDYLYETLWSSYFPTFLFQILAMDSFLVLLNSRQVAALEVTKITFVHLHCSIRHIIVFLYHMIHERWSVIPYVAANWADSNFSLFRFIPGTWRKHSENRVTNTKAKSAIGSQVSKWQIIIKRIYLIWRAIPGFLVFTFVRLQISLLGVCNATNPAPEFLYLFCNMYVFLL